jgi:hypothetical protein
VLGEGVGQLGFPARAKIVERLWPPFASGLDEPEGTAFDSAGICSSRITAMVRIMALQRSRLRWHTFHLGPASKATFKEDQPMHAMTVDGNIWRDVEVPFDHNHVGVEISDIGWWWEHACFTCQIEVAKTRSHAATGER